MVIKKLISHLLILLAKNECKLKFAFVGLDYLKKLSGDWIVF